jgi:branched-chain amino acid transport system ATP-binding protein
VLTVEKINAGYGHLQVLQDVDLNVQQGELVCVIGPNGAGKTTLLRAICGVLGVASGSIKLDGRTVQGLEPSAVVACGIAMVPEGRRVFGPLTVKENLLLGAYLRRGQAQRAEVRRDLEEAYRTFPILERREGQMAGLLSGGEQQMLAIARAMMSRPKLLLLDEPSMGLAPLIVKDIFRVLGQLRGQTTILLVEQNARIALQLADRGYVLERGKVVSGGSRNDLLKDDLILKSYLGTSEVTRH